MQGPHRCVQAGAACFLGGPTWAPRNARALSMKGLSDVKGNPHIQAEHRLLYLVFWMCCSPSGKSPEPLLGVVTVTLPFAQARPFGKEILSYPCLQKLMRAQFPFIFLDEILHWETLKKSVMICPGKTQAISSPREGVRRPWVLPPGLNLDSTWLRCFGSLRCPRVQAC